MSKVLKKTSFTLYNIDSDTHYMAIIEMQKAFIEIADRYNCAKKIEHKRMYRLKANNETNQHLIKHFGLNYKLK